MQEWVKQEGSKWWGTVRGRDAAGKGRHQGSLSPSTPRSAGHRPARPGVDRERTQWYEALLWRTCPSAGEMVLFDRSWYNRAGVERVMGFAATTSITGISRACPEFRADVIRSGITLIKYWFSVGDEEQEKRSRSASILPIKRWKFSPMDLQSRSRWVEYSRAKDDMFTYTDTEGIAPGSWWTPTTSAAPASNCISPPPWQGALRGDPLRGPSPCLPSRPKV